MMDPKKHLSLIRHKRLPVCEECKRAITKRAAMKYKAIREAWTDEEKEAEWVRKSNATKKMWENDDYRELKTNQHLRWTDEQKEEIARRKSEKMKEIWTNRTDEEISERSRKISESVKQHYQSMSDEEKLDHSERIKAGIADMSDEAKRQKSINSSLATSNYLAGLSEEEKAERYQKARESHLSYWNELTDEERAERGKLISEGIANMSEEDKQRRSENSSRATREYMDSLTEEEKAELSRKAQEFWANMSEEEYTKYRLAQSEARKNQFSRIEVEFINELNKLKIQYQPRHVVTTKHEEFDKLFPVNPITGGRVFASKEWDFIITTLEGNVLVDLDGSIHSNSNDMTVERNKVSYKLIDEIRFQESLRPYQTDGLKAYIILCHTGTLKDDSPIYDVSKPKELLTLKQFLTIIQFQCMTEKEQKKLISSSDE